MKYIALLSVLAFTLIACSGTKNTTKNNTEMDKATVSDNTKMEHADGTPERAHDGTTVPGNTTGGIAGQTNGSTGAMNNLQAVGGAKSHSFDYEQMYTDLEMTDEQIRSFRSAMEDFQEKQVNMPNGEMLGSIESERTRQLKDILSSEQFKKYSQWQADN